MLLYRPGAVLSLRSVMLEFEAVYTGLPVCSLCLFFETAKLIQSQFKAVRALCITPLNGHYELFVAHVWFVWFVWFVSSGWSGLFAGRSSSR